MTSKIVKLTVSYLLAVAILAILLRDLCVLTDSLAWMLMAFGLASGWAAGILLAPYQSEQNRFRDYLKVVSSFIAGYAVSKVDRLFDLWLDPAHGPLALSPIFAHRSLICLTSFLLAAVLTYVGRKYVSSGPGAEQPPKPT